MYELDYVAQNITKLLQSYFETERSPVHTYNSKPIWRESISESINAKDIKNQILKIE